MGWDEQIERASFRGVEFDSQTTDDEMDPRLVEHTYPYRDGADVEFLGRKPRHTRLRAIFLGPESLGDLGGFLQAVDAGKKGLFQHPLMGSWQAKAFRYPVHHGHDQRDMSTVEVEFIEDGTDTALPDLFSVAAAQAEVYSACDDVEVSRGVLDQVIDDVNAVVADAREFAAGVQGAIRSVTERVNQIRASVLKAIAAINAIKALADPSKWPLVSALKRLVLTTKKLGQAVQSLSPPVVLHDVAVTMSATMLAHALYGDSSRAKQIADLNHLRNPSLIPAGTQLKVYGK